MKYEIVIDEKKFEVEIGDIEDGRAQVTVNNQGYDVNIENYSELTAGGEIRSRNPAPAQIPAPRPAFTAPAEISAPVSAPVAGGGVVVAPIPGIILAINVKVGDSVSAGQVVAIMEAMKMENNLVSNITGKVLEIRFQKEAQVSTGDVIMVIG
jgi:biotin carboxyl carrier protein